MYERNILGRIPCLFVDEAARLMQDIPELTVVVYKAKETNAAAGVVKGKFYWVDENGGHNLLTPTTSATALSADTISEVTAGSGVTVDGVLLKDGGITVDGSGITSSVSNAIVPVIKAAAQNNITAGTGGAIPITNYLTTINTDAGGDAFTLADGDIIGMLKKVLLVVDGGGDATITPANLANGTTITMNDATDYVILMWNGTDWVVIENFGSTIA